MNRAAFALNQVVSYATDIIADFQIRERMAAAEQAVVTYVTDKPEDAYQRHEAAADLAGIISYAHGKPKGRIQSKRLLIFKDFTVSFEFDLVLGHAEKLFLTENDFHAERAGRTVLAPAAVHGLGREIINWKNIVGKMVSRVETWPDRDTREEDDRNLLYGLIQSLPGKQNTSDLYLQLAEQVAQRLCNINPDDDFADKKRDRGIRLLAEGIEYPQILNGHEIKPRGQENSEMLAEAYARAKQRYSKALLRRAET